MKMTAGFTMLLPMIGAPFSAMLAVNLLHREPSYELLPGWARFAKSA
jgi:hypothetical protein